MKGITVHLWFDNQAKEAAEFYCSTFEGSRTTDASVLHDTPSGDTEIVSFELAGRPFQAISAGPLFSFNPSISLNVACRSAEEADRVWERLSSNGTVLMEYGEYPWSKRYGWAKDRFGLSWQIALGAENEAAQTITPVLMFVGDVCGRAEEAVEFYTSTFLASGRGSLVDSILHYGGNEAPDAQGTLKYGAFHLGGTPLVAMDSAQEHDFGFNEAISLMVHCDTQEEIDLLWNRLSAVPEAEQCGWLKDRFGVSWQIVPTAMASMLAQGNETQIARVTQAFLKMKKFDIAVLEAAFHG